MTEILKQYGFVFIGTCSCDGVYTEKYKLGDYQVRWRKKQGKFKVRRFDSSITQWISDKELIEFLNVKKVA